MSTLYQRYRAEISHWDWDDILDRARNNPSPDLDDGATTDSCGCEYLGTLINPSGKYYLPFATGNVDPCPVCKGRGILGNRHANPELLKGLLADSSALRMAALEQYGAWANGQWPVELVARLEQIDKRINRSRPELECSRCGGLGSYEAYQDQEFWRALDDVASSHGGWIEAGEGDPLDTFFCLPVQIDEAEELEEAE